MENGFITSGDLALWEQRRNYGGECGYHRGGGKSTTAIGLASGLGGGALLLAIAGLWGVNQASKARSHGNEKNIDTINGNLAQLTQLAIMERQSRETWQNQHAPTLAQYVDVRTGALAGSYAGSNAFARAEADLVSGALTGQFSRCPQEVTLVSKQSCPCPASNPCGCGGM